MNIIKLVDAPSLKIYKSRLPLPHRTRFDVTRSRGMNTVVAFLEILGPFMTSSPQITTYLRNWLTKIIVS
jgi:hypothetical protein